MASILPGEPEKDVLTTTNNDELITSDDPLHPANLICELCRGFYTLGWVTGTGGGASIRSHDHIYIAPSGVQKERLKPSDMFVLDLPSKTYIRKPSSLKPSACTPLFLAAFEKRGAGACVHSHSIWAVLVTLLVEGDERERKLEVVNGHSVFQIEKLEQIKGVGRAGMGNLGYFDRLVVPIIENTAREEDLTESLEAAMNAFPETNAVLVRRHGIYVWGDDWHKAKTQAESLDYIFQLAVEMRKLGIPWT